MGRQGTSRTATATLLTAAVWAGALALGACSRGGDGAAPTESTADSTAGSTGVGSTLPRSVTGAVDLRRLVVSNAPAGYDLLASPPFGEVDLQEVLDVFSDAPLEDRAILEEARFRTGYTRGWRRADPVAFLGIFVFEFADEQGARSARERFLAQSEAEKNAARFPVEGIADAVGQSYSREDAGEPFERVHVVTFVRGPRLYQVTGQSPDEQAPVDETVAFAKIQDQIAA
jgi:hypothetical protein